MKLKNAVIVLRHPTDVQGFEPVEEVERGGVTFRLDANGNAVVTQDELNSQIKKAVIELIEENL